MWTRLLRAGALVQVVDILRAEKVAAGELRFKLGERDVRGIGLGLGAVGAALGIELPHQRWIALERLGRADLFDAMSRPEPVGRAKGGQAAFGADACAGEDEDAVGGGDGDGHDQCCQVPVVVAVQRVSSSLRLRCVSS